jgi:hypothetical protein
MIIQGHISQCHATLILFIAPFKNIIMQQGLVDKGPVLLGHYNNRSNFNNGIFFEISIGEYAPAFFTGGSNINAFRNKIQRGHLKFLYKLISFSVLNLQAVILKHGIGDFKRTGGSDIGIRRWKSIA